LFKKGCVMKTLSVLKIAIISVSMVMTTLYKSDAAPLQPSRPEDSSLKQQLACLNRKIKTEVIIYTTPTCSYCKEAKKLLHQTCVKFREIDVSNDPQKRSFMAKRANGKTSVPQIFINNISIGGSTDLAELKDSGKLATMYGLQCCSF
jgi:glutaredoxin 3